MKKNKRILLLLLIILGVAAAFVYARLTQEEPETEAVQTLDIVLVMDHSYSMYEYKDGRMWEAQSAAINFLNLLNPETDRASLVRFSDKARLDVRLTNNLTEVKDVVYGFFHDRETHLTNVSDAIELARTELKSETARAGSSKVIILLSDGGVNRPYEKGYPEFAREEALKSARLASQDGLIIYTVLLGKKNTDEELMKKIAEEASGKAYVSPHPIDLISIYENIASDITTTKKLSQSN